MPVSQASQLRAAAASSAAVAAQQNTIQIPQIQVVQPMIQHIPGIGQVRLSWESGSFLFALQWHVFLEVALVFHSLFIVFQFIMIGLVKTSDVYYSLKIYLHSPNEEVLSFR